MMRFSRFVAVGGLCALLTNVLVIGLVHHGFGSVAATALAFVPVLLVGYALHTVVTFGARPCQRSFARYALATAVNFPVWIAALYVFCDALKVSISIAAPLTTVLIFLGNYVSAKWAFLRRSEAAPSGERRQLERPLPWS
jgi:putative flippase GtrA